MELQNCIEAQGYRYKPDSPAEANLLKKVLAELKFNAELLNVDLEDYAKVQYLFYKSDALSYDFIRDKVVQQEENMALQQKLMNMVSKYAKTEREQTASQTVYKP